MIISFIPATQMFDHGWHCKEKLEASHSEGVKDLIVVLKSAKSKIFVETIIS